MADKLTAQRRSWNMSRIRSRDTAPEKIVRSLLHSLGFRFRLHHSGLPGKPDLVLRRYNTVIFIHGCFWHQHPGCIDCSKPSSNSQYWSAKLARNVERDKQNKARLIKAGWNIILIWECETKRLDILEKRLLKKLVSLKR